MSELRTLRLGSAHEVYSKPAPHGAASQEPTTHSLLQVQTALQLINLGQWNDQTSDRGGSGILNQHAQRGCCGLGLYRLAKGYS